MVNKTISSIAGALLLLAYGLTGPAAGQEVKNVKVVNTPTVTVANTPSVTVSNTPTVTVGNTPSVTVTNTPNVNITNNNTQPIFATSIDDPGRIPYQSHVSNSGGSCTGAISCAFEFGTAPAGHRIVIQHVSGLIDFSGNASAVWVLLNNGSGSPVSSFFAPLVPTASLTVFDQTVQAYFDAGTVIEVVVNLNGATFPISGFSEDITVSGYALDCAAAPCAPIARS